MTLTPTPDAGDTQSREKEMLPLFFGALYRLGISAIDWEIWYGTRPLMLPGHEAQAVRVLTRAGHSASRWRGGYRGR